MTIVAWIIFAAYYAVVGWFIKVTCFVKDDKSDQ